MVLVTKEWCGACKNLKASFVDQELVSFQKAAADFNLVSITGEEPQIFQDVGYVPRAYFLDSDGIEIAVKGPHPEYPRFFYSASVLTATMNEVTNKKTNKKTNKENEL